MNWWMVKLMSKLIRCHLDFLFNRTTVLIFFLILLFSLGGNLYAVFTINPQYGYLENNLYYSQNTFFILKLLTNFSAIFVFAYAFLRKNDQYGALFLVRGVSRSKYFLTKIIALSFFVFLFLYFEISIYIIVGFLFQDSFFLQIDFLISFFNLLLQNLYYGLLGLLLVQFLNNIYAMIIPFFILVFGQIFNEEQGRLTEIYAFFFATFVNDKMEFVLGSYHIILMIILFLAFNLLVYLNKDLF